MAVRVEHNGFVTTVILSRPEARNAVDRQTAEELAAAFQAFEEDERARVAVFWGEHGHFCAGADLRAIARGEGNRIESEGEAPMGPSRMRMSKPVIAAIAGYAVAGGLELALWCDLRVMETDATLGVFCRRWGVPLIDGGTARLPRIIGMGRALDLILTGRPVGAEEALAMGLVNRVAPSGESRRMAETLAAELATLPQRCMLSDRRSVYEGMDLPFADALANEFALGMRVLDEGIEGARAFTERRAHGTGHTKEDGAS